MSEYDFFIDNIRFSYSSVSTYDSCNYAFRLAYIDAFPRINNFFSEYGTLTHVCMEKYFRYELDSFELSDFYNTNYDEYVKSTLPIGDPEKYKSQGQEFFDNFTFDREAYDILVIEDKIDFELDGVNFVAKPDLVLRHKKTGETTLYDYKTAMPFRVDNRTQKEITDKQKINGYYKQMFLYTHALREYKGIPLDKITLLFTRASREVTIDWDRKKENDALKWLLETVGRIKQDNNFNYNNSNLFFCNNLCGVRNFCEYR